MGSGKCLNHEFALHFLRFLNFQTHIPGYSLYINSEYPGMAYIIWRIITTRPPITCRDARITGKTPFRTGLKKTRHTFSRVCFKMQEEAISSGFACISRRFSAGLLAASQGKSTQKCRQRRRNCASGILETHSKRNRPFASLRVTRLHTFVILSGAKDLFLLSYSPNSRFIELLPRYITLTTSMTSSCIR